LIVEPHGGRRRDRGAIDRGDAALDGEPGGRGVGGNRDRFRDPLRAELEAQRRGGQRHGALRRRKPHGRHADAYGLLAGWHGGLPRAVGGGEKILPGIAEGDRDDRAAHDRAGGVGDETRQRGGLLAERNEKEQEDHLSGLAMKR
jgi:hypothetical protein